MNQLTGRLRSADASTQYYNCDEGPTVGTGTRRAGGKRLLANPDVVHPAKSRGYSRGRTFIFRTRYPL